MNTVLATPAPKPRSTTARNIAWLYAGVLTLMAVAQLFAFEEFRPLFEYYGLAGGQGTSWLIASLIVIGEVFALPFLLRMDLSSLMRWFSLFCGGFVAALWMLLSISTLSRHLGFNSGILGTKLVLHMGVPAVFVSFILIVLAGLSIWGLWPTYKKR